MRDWTDEEWDEYIKEVNAAYWAEETEMKLGIHLSQTHGRDIKGCMNSEVEE